MECHVCTVHFSGRLFKNGKKLRKVRSRHFEESENEQIDIFDVKVWKFSLHNSIFSGYPVSRE